MALIIGLTGGIATGKSTISGMFKTLDIPVIDTDKIAKSLLVKERAAYHEILDLLGEEILSTDGEINRNKLAKIIFTDEATRKKINQIIHPKVKSIVKTEIDHLEDYDTKYIVVDVPLLFETDFHKVCDITVLVFARQIDQIERLVIRDKIDIDYARKKVKAQLPMSKKKAMADYIIDNSKSILETKKSFERFMQKLRDQYGD